MTCKDGNTHVSTYACKRKRLLVVLAMPAQHWSAATTQPLKETCAHKSSSYASFEPVLVNR